MTLPSELLLIIDNLVCVHNSNLQASCDIAFRVAREKGTIVAGGIIQSGVFKLVKVGKKKAVIIKSIQDAKET